MNARKHDDDVEEFKMCVRSTKESINKTWNYAGIHIIVRCTYICLYLLHLHALLLENIVCVCRVLLNISKNVKNYIYKWEETVIPYLIIINTFNFVVPEWFLASFTFGHIDFRDHLVRFLFFVLIYGIARCFLEIKEWNEWETKKKEEF